MNQDELLQHAIHCARIGDSARARDFFLEAIELDPENVIAWAWLVDLVEDLEDRIFACEKVLAKTPDNLKIQARLHELISLRPPSQEITFVDFSNQVELENLLEKAERFLAEGQRDQAKNILIPYVKTEKQNERAWMLLSQTIDDETKQALALKNVLRINPSNKQARLRLDELQHFIENPLDLAARYEEQGKYEEALAAYQRSALVIQSGPQFDHIYARISWLEKHKTSGVVYVPPDYSIARLTFGPPTLFFSLMLVHNQMNPFAFTPLLWLALMITLGGGFLLAVANVRSRHMIWVKFFDDPGGGGSPLARITLALAGWMLILISFAFLFQISLERLPLVNTNIFLP